MTLSAPRSETVADALDRVVREDRGRLLSALLARVRDFSLAEEALQDAVASAVVAWARHGLPGSPQGWLLKAAWRKVLDRVRRGATEARTMAGLRDLTDEAITDPPDDIADERLRLIFTCCHPALEQKSRVALTLRVICGLTTPEVASAFLDHDTTMGQRLSRAKAKIAAARIPYAVPEPDQWAERLDGVLAVVYLIFNAGYSAAPDATRDLAGEAIFLARLLDQLCPDQPEVEGALALLLLTHARRAARVSPDGEAVPPAAQDRALWDHVALAEGRAILERALKRGVPGPYQVKAAIAACHTREAGSDWPQIAALYDVLVRFEPTPVVGLNRAVAIAEAGAPEVGLKLLETLTTPLAPYQPFHAAHAHLLAMTGAREAAAAAYDRAIAMAATPEDAAFLKARRRQIAMG